MKSIILFILAMVAMLCMFCESNNLKALLIVKAIGFALFFIIYRIANYKTCKR